LSIYGSSNVIKAATYLQSTIFGGIFLGAARMRCQQECYGNKSWVNESENVLPICPNENVTSFVKRFISPVALCMRVFPNFNEGLGQNLQGGFWIGSRCRTRSGTIHLELVRLRDAMYLDPPSCVTKWRAQWNAQRMA